MWLNPGMFDQGNPVPLSSKGESLKKWITALMILHCFVALSELILLDMMKGIFEFVTIMILYWGSSSHHFCMILMYNIMILFNSVQLFAELGSYVQNEAQSQPYDSKMNTHNYSSTFFVPYLIGIFWFYIFAMTVTFLFYRECKQSMMYGVNPNDQQNRKYSSHLKIP